MIRKFAGALMGAALLGALIAPSAFAAGPQAIGHAAEHFNVPFIVPHRTVTDPCHIVDTQANCYGDINLAVLIGGLPRGQTIQGNFSALDAESYQCVNFTTGAWDQNPARKLTTARYAVSLPLGYYGPVVRTNGQVLFAANFDLFSPNPQWPTISFACGAGETVARTGVQLTQVVARVHVFGGADYLVSVPGTYAIAPWEYTR